MDIKPTHTANDLGSRALTDIGQLNSLKTIGDKRQQAEQVATQFESVFMEMMMKAMRETVPEDGLFSGGQAESTYRSMLDQQLVQMKGSSFDPRFHQRLVESIMDQSATREEAIARTDEKKARIEAGEALELKPAELAQYGFKSK
jgi:flagellar protein FlgJ